MTLADYQPGLGASLALARWRAGMTQWELAEAAGVKSHAMISKYETGSRVPGSKTLAAMAQALNTTVDQLLSEGKRVKP